MSTWLSGLGVTRGIGIGRVLRLHGQLDIPEYAVDDVEAEVARFTAANKTAKAQLREVRAQVPGLSGTGAAGSEIAAFIDTHLLMLGDRSLTVAVAQTIREQRLNAESALMRQRDALIAVFERMEDPYLRVRKDDVRHVADRMLRVLLKQDRPVGTRADTGNEASIVVADDITPADIILLARQGAAGFVTEYGGPLSHTAILARSLGIPTVVGVHQARRLLRDGELLIVDGGQGHLLASPDTQALDWFRTKRERQLSERAALSALRDRAAVSRDGIAIQLLANIERVEDAAQAAALRAEGVGLYRTEFLYMNRKDLPDEDEQYAAYARVVSSVKGEITIRTLDLGADKQVDSGARSGPTPNNPALGLRAIRLCLKEPALFRTQLRALLRASALGRVRIMLPMISSLQEFRQAQQLIRTAREELIAEGHAVAEQVPVGAMIEVPAAALSAALLAQQAEFFSIGTNDLIQYTLAIDRVDDEVNYLYDPLHPAVLQLIRMTIDAGAAAGRPVAMCGEMAGDPRYTRLLLGLGLTQFSMHPASLLEIKRIVIDADIGALRQQAQALLRATTPAELQQQLAEFVR